MSGARQGQTRGVFFGVFLFFLSACGADGGFGGSNQSNPVTTPQSSGDAFESMDLGDVQFLDFGGDGSVDIRFEDAAAGDTYLAVLHSHNILEGDFNLFIQGSASVAPTAALTYAMSTEALPALMADEAENPMHESMRAWGTVFAQDASRAALDSEGPTYMALTSALQLDSVKDFRVLNSLSSVTTYADIEGRLRYMDDDVLIYVDTEMDGSSDLDDEDIAEVAANFSGHALPKARSLFGEESDVNGDDRISIVMTPVLNRICLSSGIVTGFFFPGDLYAQDNTNPASNEQEIFYTLVPDPFAKHCRSLGIDFTIKNILPGVLAHEFQHMVSFNQHVLVSRGVTEEPWLNEALSHLAEDLTGFGQENYARVKLFLDQSNSTSLIPAGLPSLAERGMSYLFLRYLYEQSDNPNQFINDLLQTNQTGVGNIEEGLSDNHSVFSTFTRSLAYWQVALILSDNNITNDARFTYQERSVDPVTGNYSGICMQCTAEDGRGTVLNGPKISTVSTFPLTLNVQSTGTQFIQLENPGESLTIQGSQGAQLGGALIRLKAN